MPLKQQTVLLSWTLHSHPSRLSCMLFCGIYLPLILDCPMHKLVISLYWDQKLLKYTLHGSCNLQHIAHYFFTTYFFMKSVQQVITIFISYMKIIIFNTPFFLCLIVIAFELTGTYFTVLEFGVSPLSFTSPVMSHQYFSHVSTTVASTV